MRRKNIKSRLRAVALTAAVSVAGVGPVLIASGPASAAMTPASHCTISHALYLQDNVLYAEVLGCGYIVPLDVYRNGVLFGDISGSRDLYYQHVCVTTDPTKWSTNWDPEQTFACS